MLCVEYGDGQRIINVNSPAFVSADRADAETAAAMHQRHESARLSNGVGTSGEPVDIVEAYDAHKDDPPSMPAYPVQR